MKTEVEKQAEFVAALSERLIEDIGRHEAWRKTSEYKSHTYRVDVPEKKCRIQADIKRVRRELLALNKLMEDDKKC